MTRTRDLTVGLVIAGLLGVLDLPSFLQSSDSGDGPPLPIAIVSDHLRAAEVHHSSYSVRRLPKP
jgi:hypothetical protein